jgi:hypothetical protein
LLGVPGLFKLTGNSGGYGIRCAQEWAAHAKSCWQQRAVSFVVASGSQDRAGTANAGAPDRADTWAETRTPPVRVRPRTLPPEGSVTRPYPPFRWCASARPGVVLMSLVRCSRAGPAPQAASPDGDHTPCCSDADPSVRSLV